MFSDDHSAARGRGEIRSLGEHVEQCEHFTRVFDLLGHLPAPPASDALLARVVAQVKSRRDDPRYALATAGAARWVLPLALVLVGAAALALHGVKAGGWFAALGVFAVALVGSAFALERPLSVLVGAALGAGALAAFGASGEASAPMPGCTIWEAAAALVPLGAAAWLMVRQRVGARGPLRLAAVAACGALGAQGLLHLGCPARDAFHLLAFHASGVVVAAALGATLGMVPALRRSAI